MEVDHRGFFRRSQWPVFEATIQERIHFILNSQEFAAVIAACIHSVLGVPNIPFFVAAIATIIARWYVVFLRRDRLYDRRAELDLVKEIFPRLLYIAVTLLLPRLSWLFGLLIRAPFEAGIRGKIASTILVMIISVLVLGFSFKSQSLGILVRIVIVIFGILLRLYMAAQDVTKGAMSWFPQIGVSSAVLDFLTNMSRSTSSNSSERQNPYHYSPLEPGEIRLLRVRRRIPFLGARAEIIHVKFASKPVYEAISYTWGTATTTTKILLDGKPFPTSTATYNVIHGRSSLWRPRMLWIDAICINQDDPIEKGQQVSLMTEIYKSATVVIVWLGQPQGFGRAWLAITLLHELSKVPNHISLYRRYENQTLTIQWRAFIELFSNLWFTRMWIVQEVAVASEVLFIYGGYSFTIDAMSACDEVFRDAEMSGLLGTTSAGKLAVRNMGHFSKIARLRRNFARASITQQSMETTKQLKMMYRVLNIGGETELLKLDQTIKSLERSRQAMSLPFLLSQFSGFNATRRRDKIFALTGVAVDSPDPAFKPDYSETKVEEIYQRVTCYILEGDNPFSVISKAGIGSDRAINDLPSWVPDWTTSPQGAPFTDPGYWDELDDSRFSASKKTTPQLAFGPAAEELRVGGFIVDEIASMGPVMASEYDDANYQYDAVGNIYDSVEWEATDAWHSETYKLAMTEARKYGSQDDTLQAFWRTLMGDQTPTLRPAPASIFHDYCGWVAYIQDNAELLSKLRSGEINHLPLEEEYWNRKQATATWSLAMGLCISGRRLGITKAGYMAVIPPKSEVGDIVSIFLGAKTPLLLRRTKRSMNEQTDSQAYKLVGECYVHGMMSGEMMDTTYEIQNLSLL